MRTDAEGLEVSNRVSVIPSTTECEQRTYGKLGQRFQRLAGLADSQEGGKSDGHRLPRLQLGLGQSSQRVDAGQKAWRQDRERGRTQTGGNWKSSKRLDKSTAYSVPPAGKLLLSGAWSRVVR